MTKEVSFLFFCRVEGYILAEARIFKNKGLCRFGDSPTHQSLRTTLLDTDRFEKNHPAVHGTDKDD